MKIMLTSDTHGNYPLLLKAHRLASPLDAIVHLGDGEGDVELVSMFLDLEIISVAGNCDHGSSVPRERLWECHGQRLLLTHGDRYGVKSGTRLLERRGAELGARAVLFGHSHQALIVSRPDMLLINPGTLMSTASRKSVALLDVTPEGVAARLLELA